MTIVTLGVVTGGITFLLSALLPVVVKPLLMRLGIMDLPNERSSHDRPILRGLGLAVLMAMIAGFGCGVLLATISAPGGADWKLLLTVGLGAIAAGLLGLTEDLRGLSVPVRSVLLLAIATAVSVLLLVLAAAGSDPKGFVWVPGLHAATLPMVLVVLLGGYGVLFVSSYINVANFMDGLNGISGFHGVIAGSVFAFSGWAMGYAWLTVAGVVLAAGYLGFLPWNLTKPGAFLGDVGSYLLGGAVAITSFAAFVNGVPFLATIGPMVIYFGDVGVTLVKRVRVGHKWDEPHKEHAYQRIQQLGYSHVQASGITALFSLLTSILGLCSLFTGVLGSLLLLAAGLAVLVVYMLLPRLMAK